MISAQEKTRSDVKGQEMSKARHRPTHCISQQAPGDGWRTAQQSDVPSQENQSEVQDVDLKGNARADVDVLFKPSTTASVTDAVQSNLSFGKKPTGAQISHRKNGIKTSSEHQPYFLPNCLMMVACERSAVYHDRRTQGHATPKAMLLSCSHCTHFDKSATALLKVRCNVGWKPKGSHKTWDLRHGVGPQFDFHAGVLFNRSIRKRGAWCLRNRLCVLTVGGEPLHATHCAHKPTQMDPRRMCTGYTKRNAQTRWFRARCSVVSRSRLPHFHFQKLHLTFTGTLGNDVKKLCPSSQLLYVTHKTISDQSR